MKTWILKGDLSRTPQAVLRMYTTGCKKSKRERSFDFITRPRHYFLTRKLKSQVKSLSRLLALEAVADMDTE